MWAVNSSNLPLVSFLLSHGADLEARSKSGTNCEAFILSSSTPTDQIGSTSSGLSKSFLGVLDAAGQTRFNNANTPQSPHTSDKELIADMIYEFGQVLVKERIKRNHQSNGPISNSPTPGRGSLAALYQRGSSLNSNPPSPSPNSLSMSPTKKYSTGMDFGNSALSPPPPSSTSNAFSKSPQNSLSRKHSRSASHSVSNNFNSISSSSSTSKSHNRHSSLSIPNHQINPTSSSSLGSRRLLGRNEKVRLAEEELRERELGEGRRRALLDIAITLEVDYSTLIGEPPIVDQTSESGGVGGKPSTRGGNGDSRTRRKQGQSQQKSVHSGLASGSGASEVGSDALSLSFDFDSKSPASLSQVLVVCPNDLPALFELLISNVKPVRAPWVNRTKPANVLFLASRWACLTKDADLLEDLILGALDRIQEEIYKKPKDLTLLSFWLSNATLLLHYTQRDRAFRIGSSTEDEETDEEEEGHQEGYHRRSTSSTAREGGEESNGEETLDPMSEDLVLSLQDCRLFLLDLINELYVFIVRDVERRIDKVLDSALLDHDAIPGFEETRFEGEWNIMRSLAGSVKAAAANASNSGSISSSPGSSSRRPISQIFGRAPNVNSSDSSNNYGSLRSSSPQKFSPAFVGQGLPDAEPFNGSPRPSLGVGPPGEGLSRLRETSYDASAADLLAKPSPRTITTLLTSTLQVLQLYEINPSIILQAFSQIFFWLGCELFNRILKNRKYLCRSRAMQIRLNISSLEDWSRNNAIPLSIISSHLNPVKHLISWLQCQSSLKDFDGLIITLQGLKTLTPNQMKRALKDYRYEIGETRMNSECEQYLDQLELDWEKRKDENRRNEIRAEREREERKKFKKQKKRNSEIYNLEMISHHRSGTATQRGYNNDSTPPSPDQDVGNESNATALVGDDLDDGASTDEEDLSPNDQAAKSAQKAIDSLFLSGRSLNDYTPPWTASGSTSTDSAVKAIGSSSHGTENGLLNSRDMLPFAMPSETEALIVTPGDAFGMGRGHWTGTGTPSLRSVAGSLNGDSSDSNFGGDDCEDSEDGGRATSPSPSNGFDELTDRLSLSNHSSAEATAAGASSIPPSPSNQFQLQRRKGRDSVISRRSANSDTSSKCSSLYPQGKGFAAGASWQPVPILPEGLLEEISEKLKADFRERSKLSLENRLNNLGLSSSAAAAAAASPSYESEGFQPQPSLHSITAEMNPNLRKSKASKGSEARAEYFGYQDEMGSEDEEKEDSFEAPTAAQIQNQKNKNRLSTFSAAPAKLVLPTRNNAQPIQAQVTSQPQPQPRFNQYAEPSYLETGYQPHGRYPSEAVDAATPTGLENRGGLKTLRRGIEASSSERTIRSGKNGGSGYDRF